MSLNKEIKSVLPHHGKPDPIKGPGITQWHVCCVLPQPISHGQIRALGMARSNSVAKYIAIGGLPHSNGIKRTVAARLKLCSLHPDFTLLLSITLSIYAEDHTPPRYAPPSPRVNFYSRATHPYYTLLLSQCTQSQHPHCPEDWGKVTRWD